MSSFMISEDVTKLSEQVMTDIAPVFHKIDETAQYNTQKVLAAFQNARVSDTCFAGTTGYGYNDKGRETLDAVYAEVFGAQTALVRTGFVNGTHAITAALFAAVSPSQTLLSVTGAPYDTLRGVIGISGDYKGSLKDYGVKYDEIGLKPCGEPDFVKIAEKSKNASAVFVQRSRGYSARRALTAREIGKICETVRKVNPACAVIVDNCYGEFTEKLEPTDVGADLIAGSLIKNPGGGLAPTGGYVAGSAELVEAAAYRLTAPGIGAECGATLDVNRLLFQGFFMAPHTTAQAMKTAVFCARLLETMGFDTAPRFDAYRSDIIQTVNLASPELLTRFCGGIQAGAPVDSFAAPIPWAMPGYDCEVIMAAGAFIQGASIELSADGPMREPYTAYLQGGLTFESGKLGIMNAASRLKTAL